MPKSAQPPRKQRGGFGVYYRAKGEYLWVLSDELKGNLTAGKLQSFVKDGQVDTNALTGVVTGAMTKYTTPTDQYHPNRT